MRFAAAQLRPVDAPDQVQVRERTLVELVLFSVTVSVVSQLIVGYIMGRYSRRTKR